MYVSNGGICNRGLISCANTEPCNYNNKTYVLNPQADYEIPELAFFSDLKILARVYHSNQCGLERTTHYSERTEIRFPTSQNTLHLHDNKQSVNDG
jgi:uncharacterized protein YqiB (DUF1249 family)